MSRQNTVDTPRQGAWYQTANNGIADLQSRFPKPQTVRLKNISAAEAKILAPIFNGRG
jgi:hypothetical protein